MANGTKWRSSIVDYGAFSNWHEMVHADYQAGAEHVLSVHGDVCGFAKTNETQDVDGDNMLDTSMVGNIEFPVVDGNTNL